MWLYWSSGQTLQDSAIVSDPIKTGMDGQPLMTQTAVNDDE